MDAAYRVQTFRKWPGERLRHMLHHHEAGKIGWQSAQQILQRLRAAGGGANGNNLVGRGDLITGRHSGRVSLGWVEFAHPDSGGSLYFGDDVAGLLDGAI